MAGIPLLRIKTGRQPMVVQHNRPTRLTLWSPDQGDLHISWEFAVKRADVSVPIQQAAVAEVARATGDRSTASPHLVGQDRALL